jgi:hypothetical protein
MPGAVHFLQDDDLLILILGDNDLAEFHLNRHVEHSRTAGGFCGVRRELNKSSENRIVRSRLALVGKLEAPLATVKVKPMDRSNPWAAARRELV